MGRSIVSRSRLWIGGLGIAGIAVSHKLAYVLAARGHGGHHHEHELLTSTGHAYWPYFAALAVGLLVAALAGFVTQRLTCESLHRSSSALFRHTALRLAAGQVAGFVSMETLERVLFAGGLTNLFAEPAVLIGLALQVLVAVAGALLILLLARTVDAVRALLTNHDVVESSNSSSWVRSQIAAPKLAVAAGGAGLRGPPARVF